LQISNRDGDKEGKCRTVALRGIAREKVVWKHLMNVTNAKEDGLKGLWVFWS